MRTRRRELLVAWIGAVALMVPFAGTATANHGPSAVPDQIALSPDTNAIPSGMCASFTVTATAAGFVAEGEVVDVAVQLRDDVPDDVIADVEAGFCDPDLEGPGTDLGSAAVDCDDNDNELESGPCVISSSERPALLHGECVTDVNGQCNFGITARDIRNGSAIGEVTAFVDADGDDAAGPGEGLDTSSLAVVATQLVPSAIRCIPPGFSRPEGTRAEFQCFVNDPTGAGVPGRAVTFDVTAGPNAEEVGPAVCPPTDASGATPALGLPFACGYVDPISADSPVGTDAVTFWVNIQAAPGETSTPGPDPHEPVTTVMATWESARPSVTIDCRPDVFVIPVNSHKLAQCVAFVDADGDAVADSGEARVPEVRIDVENMTPDVNDQDDAIAGPVDFDDACVTGADGVCSAQTWAFEATAGTIIYCAYADLDADNDFDLFGSSADGGHCDFESGPDGKVGDDPGTDLLSHVFTPAGDGAFGWGNRNGLLFEFDVQETSSGVVGRFTARTPSMTLKGSIDCLRVTENRVVFGGTSPDTDTRFVVSAIDNGTFSNEDGLILGERSTPCDTSGFGDPSSLKVVGEIVVYDAPDSVAPRQLHDESDMGATTRITFDESGRFAGQTIGSQYGDVGVTFVDDASRTPAIQGTFGRRNFSVFPSVPSSTFSGENSLILNYDSSIPPTQGSSNLAQVINFTPSVMSVGMYVGNGELGTTARLRAYSESGVLLFTAEAHIDDNVDNFIGIDGGSTLIARVELDYGASLLAEELDDLMFSY